MSPRWVLTEKTGFSGGPEVIREALHAQRRRFATYLMGLTAPAWNARSRCSQWSVHEVVRHCLDVAELHGDRLAGRQGRFAKFGRFDPRTTPLAWLADSPARTPAETCEEFLALIDEEDRLFASRAGKEGGDPVRGVLGRPLHWSVASLHIFWDAWLHERDVAVPLGAVLRPSEVELRLMTLYGLLIAAMPAAMSGDPLRVSLTLDGSADHSYEISSTGDDIEVAAGATRTADLRGPAVPVLDSLAGRGPALAELVGSTASVVERLSRLRAVVT